MDVLFGPYKHHREPWKKSAEITNACPGKDTLDVNCKCPDLMYSTRIRVITGDTIESRLYCGCCELLIRFP